MPSLRKSLRTPPPFLLPFPCFILPLPPSFFSFSSSAVFPFLSLFPSVPLFFSLPPFLVVCPPFFFPNESYPSSLSESLRPPHPFLLPFFFVPTSLAFVPFFLFFFPGSFAFRFPLFPPFLLFVFLPFFSLPNHKKCRR